MWKCVVISASWLQNDKSAADLCVFYSVKPKTLLERFKVRQLTLRHFSMMVSSLPTDSWQVWTSFWISPILSVSRSIARSNVFISDCSFKTSCCFLLSKAFKSAHSVLKFFIFSRRLAATALSEREISLFAVVLIPATAELFLLTSWRTSWNENAHRMFFAMFQWWFVLMAERRPFGQKVCAWNQTTSEVGYNGSWWELIITSWS